MNVNESGQLVLDKEQTQKKIKLSAADVLAADIKTLDEAEAYILQGEHLERVGWIAKAKGFKAIRDGIKAGDPEYSEYDSFNNYCTREGNSNSQAITYIKGLEALDALISKSYVGKIPGPVVMTQGILLVPEETRKEAYSYWVETQCTVPELRKKFVKSSGKSVSLDLKIPPITQTKKAFEYYMKNNESFARWVANWFKRETERRAK